MGDRARAGDVSGDGADECFWDNPGDSPGDRPGERLNAAASPGAARRFLVAWGERLLAERERWVLWTPVGIGLGIILYFSLTFEPAGWIGPVAVLAAAAPAFVLRHRPAALIACLGALSVAAGFAASQGRTALVAAPVLEHPLAGVTVTGRVIALEDLAPGARLLLSEVRVDRLAREATPGRVRIRLPERATLPPIGAEISVRAALHPPSEPAAPGAYDFQRHAFFQGIGAVGYALAAVRVDPGPAPPLSAWERGGLAFERVRQTLAERVALAVDGPERAVTAALLNGEQTGIDGQVMDDMRRSGLAHLLSISGLHIGLVAGLVFVTVRSLLALVEPVALRHPIKKWAALVGLLAAVAYTLVVGAPVPTVRSLLMTGLVLVAVLTDRNPLSMRLVAFAATAVMLAAPESLLGPSFQMSFSAVAALIAGFEAIARRSRGWRAQAGWAGRAGLYLGGVAYSSLLATLATTPFSIFHFQQIAFYGLLANMVAVPITSFWVMPWGLISYLAMPFGLDRVPLQAVGWGVTGILRTAEITAGLPGATAPLPAMPEMGLAVAVVGGLWLTLWTGRWRAWGVAGVMLGMLSLAVADRPDVLVTGDGKLMAVRGAGGSLMLSSRQAGRFAAETWLRRDGAVPEVGRVPLWPAAGGGADGGLSCDALGCRYRAKGRVVSLVRDVQALAEDCRSSDLVIATVSVRRCAAPAIDFWGLRRGGAHAVYLGSRGIRVETVGGRRGLRPWATGAPPLTAKGASSDRRHRGRDGDSPDPEALDKPGEVR